MCVYLFKGVAILFNNPLVRNGQALEMSRSSRVYGVSPFPERPVLVSLDKVFDICITDLLVAFHLIVSFSSLPSQGT